jgi:hypothetical protein
MKLINFGFGICVFIALLLLTLLILENVTSEITKIERVKCIDKQGAEFEDEWCIKEFRCGVVVRKLDPQFCYGRLKNENK